MAQPLVWIMDCLGEYAGFSTLLLDDVYERCPEIQASGTALTDI